MTVRGKVRKTGRQQGETLVVGLTGSIGMGKSTISKWFQELGVPVDDADATVHRLYSPGGAAVAPIKAFLGPEVIGEDGGVNRVNLSKFVVGEANTANLKKLEAIVHPMVEDSRDNFITAAKQRGEALCVLDIPLLLEKGLEKYCDLVLVVSAGAAQQRERVLARPGMTVEKFEGILAKQVPDAEKRALADQVLDSSLSMEGTRAQVVSFVTSCRQQIEEERKSHFRRHLFLATALTVGLAAVSVPLLRAARHRL